jgi:hypothetical protein
MAKAEQMHQWNMKNGEITIDLYLDCIIFAISTESFYK